MTLAHLINSLKALEFKQGNTNSWIFTTPHGYTLQITVDKDTPENSSISYGPKIEVHHKGILNFKKPENVVVLECVTRLLNKSYAPENIELEKIWPSGHGTSGRLDILLTQGKAKNKKCFAMIECKQWGGEYSKERGEMLKDGGQLFSYAIQEATTKYLTLYASTISAESTVKILAEQVEYAPLHGTNQEEKYSSWDKSFQLGGLFSDIAGPYLSPKKNLKKEELIELDEETGKGLFNSFADILRRHAISDKSNAFNKIFNLFVCKICDEDYKVPGDELDFQWRVGDAAKELVENRLPKLYIKGLKEYLQVDVDKNFFSPLAEFAFVDTYDQKSYERNASVIREVVELLQPYQIKYTQKHQFLGDFFEDLLNSGIKQEAGQFFTPTIVARFFLKSIPIHDFVDEQIKNGSSDILPFIIDFSCGAGHFLTEAIDELQEKIDLVDPKTLLGRHQKRFLSIKDNFYWAKDYIYGIEKDYRLAKTTKIAMFLYGDGDAVIVNGDGLDDFSSSKTYQGVLKATEAYQYLEKFDVIVSNPPFSISGFKADVPNVDENFSLAGSLTLTSSEIECLFIERCAHLLKPNGFMGLILPLSILNSEHRIYQEARKLLLIQFEIAGLVELRDKTFKPTNTTTVGVFAKKRSQDVLLPAAINICYAIKGNKKASPSASAAVELAIELGASEAALHRQADDLLPSLQDKEEPQWIEGCNLPDEFTLALSNLLNNKQIALAFSGDKKEQEEFLGYRYSKARGRESIEELRTDTGALLSSLYDEKSLKNPRKVNAHIIAAFSGAPIAVPKELQASVKYVCLNDMVSSTAFILDNPSNHFVSDMVVTSNSPIGDIIDAFPQKPINWDVLIKTNKIVQIPGLVYSKKSETPSKTKKKVLTASNLDLKTGKLDLSAKLIHLDDNYPIPPELCPKRGDIVISKSSGSLKHLGKAVYITEDLKNHAVGGFLTIIRCVDEKLGKALFYRLLSRQFRLHVAGLKGQNINNIDLESIKSAGLTIPVDLGAFTKIITAKEAELADINEKMATLKNG